MKKLILIFGAIAVILMGGNLIAGEIYRWIDDKGTIVFSDSPPPPESFKKQKIEDEIDKTIEKKKEVEKRADIDESKKSEQKFKIQLEHEKKTKSIKDYDQMRLELRFAVEKYQKKYDELERQWHRNSPGSSGRYDFLVEAEKLKREYREEVRRIKEYFGYH